MGSGASAAPGQPSFQPEIEKKHSELELKQGDLERSFEGLKADLNTKLKEILAAEGKRIEALIEQRAQVLSEKLTSQSQEQARELASMNEAIQGPLQNALTRIEAVEPQLLSFRQELDQVATSAAHARQELREEFKASLESATAASHKQVSDLGARGKAAEEKQAKLHESLRADLVAALQRCDSLQAAIDGLEREQETVKVVTEQVRENIVSVQHVFEEKSEEQQGTMQEEIRGEIQRVMDRMEEERQVQAVQLAEMEGSIRANQQAIKSARNVAESVHSRSMTWRLRSFHKRLASILSREEDVCLQSPNFTLCALPEMRLELQIGARDGGGSLDTAVPLPCVPVPVPGSCTVRLWAPAGMYACFRVTIGEGASAVSKRFEYTFKPEVSAGLPDEQGRYFFVMQNFVQLDNVWVKAKDTIQIVFDLLEFKCAPVPVSQSMEVTTRPAVSDLTVLNPEEAGSAAGEASPRAEGSSSPAAEGGRKPSFLEKPPSFLAATGRSDLDDLAFARSGTSEGLLEERVRNELQAIRNRSVRRVEWRVEGVQRMIDVCKIGESVDSPPFCAAGLERIVFHFYPKGYDASSTSGVMSPCALFISGPVRTTVRGMMWVGTLSRQLEHRFRGKGDTGGRNKFGPLETQVDASDMIVIALEIMDVETDLPDGTHSLVLRDAGDKAGTKGHASPMRGDRSGKMSGEASPVVRPSDKSITDASPVSFGKGTLKVKREDPTKTEELIRCVSLPTLNARQLHMPIIKGRKASALGC